MRPITDSKVTISREKLDQVYSDIHMASLELKPFGNPERAKTYINRAVAVLDMVMLGRE